MPSDLILKTMNAVHRGVFRLSGNRAGWTVYNMPVLELVTTGRRSGQSHAVMLTSPLQEGDVYVVVASRGGDDRPPAWYLNLVDDGRVQVRTEGSARRPMTARVATPTERDRLWPLVANAHRMYAGYQAKTQREIPLVLLEPTGTSR